MTGWAHRGHSIRAEPTPTPATPLDDAADQLVLRLLRSARFDAQRSPEEIRVASLFRRGPHSQQWRTQ